MGTSLKTTTSLGMVLRAGFAACALLALSSFPAQAQTLPAQPATPTAHYLPDSGYSQRRETQVANRIKNRNQNPDLEAALHALPSKSNLSKAFPPLAESKKPDLEPSLTAAMPKDSPPPVSGNAATKSGTFINPFDTIATKKIDASPVESDATNTIASAVETTDPVALPRSLAKGSFDYSMPQPMLIPTRPLYPQAAVAPVAARPTRPSPPPVDVVQAAPVPQLLPIPDVNAPPPPVPVATQPVQEQTIAANMVLPEPVAVFAATAPTAPVAPDVALENQSLSDTEKEVEALRKEAQAMVEQAARKPEDAPTLSQAPASMPVTAQPPEVAPEIQLAQSTLPTSDPSVRPEILPMPDQMPSFKPYATIETQNKMPHPSQEKPEKEAPAELPKPILTAPEPVASTTPVTLIPPSQDQTKTPASIPTKPAEVPVPVADHTPNLLPLPDISNAPKSPSQNTEKDTSNKPPSLADVKISVPKKGISPASKKILNDLPSGVGSEKPEKPGRLSIKRFDPAIEGILNAPVTSDDKVETSESGGVTIQVKSPAFNADYELEKAYNALVGGQSEDAKNIYLNILTQDPNNESALFGIASTFHRMNNRELARPFYGRLLKINPNHRDGLNNFLVLMSEEDPQEALTELKELERRNPDFSPIPAQMAVIYSKSGDVEAARTSMVRAIQLAPENVAYKYNYAVMMDKQGDYAQAADMYRQLIDASEHGQKLPTDVNELQERLVYINSQIKH